MGELFSVLDTLAADDVHSMPVPLLVSSTEMLLTARNRLDAEIARRLQASDIHEATVLECGRTTRSWLVEEQMLAPDEATRRMSVARSLPSHPTLAAAFVAGDISHDHVRTILGCLRKLPGHVTDVAETELTAAARHADPVSLGRLCREIRIRTGADEDAEAAAQRLYDSRWAAMSRTFEGTVHLEAMLDPESGAVLEAAIAPLMSSRTAGDDRTTWQRRADALVDLAQRALNRGELPDHNGDRPQIAVTISWEELCRGLTAGRLPTATCNGTLPITPATVRRLACDADLIPAVLGSRGEVLDLGRSTPTWSTAQRRARRIEDKGCTWPRCQAGLDRCQIHHLDFVSRGGPTDKDNGTHLCRFHHWLAHHRRWAIVRGKSGRIEVYRT